MDDVDDLAGAGKSAEALERGTRELREVARDLVGPPAAELGHYFADRVRIFRFKSTVLAAAKAKEMVAAAGLNIQPIDLKRLVPLLEGASLEEDDDLLAKWAGLIASAATGSDVLPAFAEILRQLTPEEARILDFLFENAPTIPGIAPPPENTVSQARLLELLDVSQESLLVRVQNLDRLNLAVEVPYELVAITPFGEAFVRACRGPSENI